MVILSYDNTFSLERASVKTSVSKDKSGFMLTEIMMALMLLCAVTLVVAQYQERCTRNSQLAQEIMQATTLARTSLESAAHNSSAKDSIVEMGKFKVNITVQPCDLIEPVTHVCAIEASKCLKRIIVDVSWRDSLRHDRHVVLGSTMLLLK